MNDAVSEKLKSFFTKYKKQNFKKGEILVRADDDPAGIFYLTQGQVKMYIISRKGDEVVLNIFKPVAFFPMSWGINQSKNNYYYEAMSAVELWRAPREEVVTFVKENPDVMFDLLSRLYKGVDGMLSRMAYLMAGNAHARLVSELIISAKRFGTKQKDGTMTITVSEKELATQTGLTRETISREIKVLKEKKIVTYEKQRMVIKDLQLLEESLMNY